MRTRRLILPFFSIPVTNARPISPVRATWVPPQGCKSRPSIATRRTRPVPIGGGGFRREMQPRRQHWFLNKKSGFPLRTPAFCSVSKEQRRLGEKEYRAPSVTPGVALRVGIQAERVTFLILKNNRKRPEQLPPSDEEKIALFDTMFAYSGSYTVESDRVVHHIDMSWNEAWSGTEQVRFCKVDGHTLTYTSVPAKNPFDGREVVHEVTYIREKLPTT